MGLPDPTGLLASNQVYIPGWCSCHCRHNQQNELIKEIDINQITQIPHLSQLNSNITEIIISRFPLHHSKSIKKFELVNDCYQCSSNYHPLINYFNPFGTFISYDSGVVIFGSNPSLINENYSCPAVNDMNGDYDGDLYWVCADSRIVSHFKDNNNNNNNVSNNDYILKTTSNLYNDQHFDNFETPPIIQSTISSVEISELFHLSDNLQLPYCRYTQLLSSNPETIQNFSNHELLEALLWEGITSSIKKYGDLINDCDYGKIQKYFQLIACNSGVAR